MDQVVLITGASNGLGKAITRNFLNQGWVVIATDIDEDSLKALPQYDKLVIITMDVSSDSSVIQAFEWVRQEGIQLDLIINNAGIDRYFPFSEASVDRFIEVFAVNLFGSYRVNQTFMPLLKKPRGRIIHIGSESLNLTIPFMPYPITKNALERYAKALRLELKPLGIDVVVVRPGAIRTNLLKSVSTIEPSAKEPLTALRFARFAFIAPRNIGKVISPERVADFIYTVSQLKNPKAIYKINNNLLLRISAFIPFFLTEKLVNKMLGQVKKI